MREELLVQYHRKETFYRSMNQRKKIRIEYFAHFNQDSQWRSLDQFYRAAVHEHNRLKFSH